MGDSFYNIVDSMKAQMTAAQQSMQNALAQASVNNNSFGASISTTSGTSTTNSFPGQFINIRSNTIYDNTIWQAQYQNQIAASIMPMEAPPAKKKTKKLTNLEWLDSRVNEIRVSL